MKQEEVMKQVTQLADGNMMAGNERFMRALLIERQAYSDEEFVALTRELTEVLHKNRTIDWNHKESARAQMRVLVKRLLKKYKYPPEGAQQALDTVMRQCDHWADQEDNLK